MDVLHCMYTARGELARPDDFSGSDFRPLVQVPQTEQGKSEVSCVLEYDHPDFIRARPMVFTDDTRPSQFTFANQVGVQTDADASDATGAPAEYLKGQMTSSSPPSDCNLESVWSLQVVLGKDMPKACALALSPSL